MAFAASVQKTIRMAGNLLVLVFIAAAAWVYFTASHASDRFMKYRAVFNEIQAECRAHEQCPSEEQFKGKLGTAGLASDRLKYFRGEYAAPAGNKPFKVERTGEQYFHAVYIPMSDIGYHASGGKDVDLVLWSSTQDASGAVIK